MKLNDIINSMEFDNNYLKNKIKALETKMNYLITELQKYNSNNDTNNLKDLSAPMVSGEKIMEVRFNSKDFQNICNWSLPCKNTNLFIRLEEILNNKFPELKKHETYFMVNSKRIKRFQSLDENGIKDNNIINIFLINS